MHPLERLFALLYVALFLAACGSKPIATAQPPTLAAGPTAEVIEPTAEPTSPPTEVAGPPAAPLDVLRAGLLEQAANPDLVGGTLYQLMGVPVAGGETLIFHFEEKIAETTVGCTGHALALLQDDGSYRIVDESVSISCGPTAVGTPITIFAAQGVDQAGAAARIIFGEVYDAAVVAIRVFYAGGETVALISSGAYYAALPPDASDVLVRAYDSSGAALYEGAPR